MGYARRTRQLMVMLRPWPCRISRKVGSTAGGSAGERKGGKEIREGISVRDRVNQPLLKGQSATASTRGELNTSKYTTSTDTDQLVTETCTPKALRSAH